MDLFYRLFSNRARRLVTLAYGVTAIAVFALLAKKGLEEAWFLAKIGETTQYLHLPVWLFYGLIVAMACLIMCFFVIRLTTVLKGEREEVEDGQHSFGDAD
jgi:TRAP-type C4-dicarboxylate transport system permease small subunit